jgi:GT2 family glycosyltransferase
MTGSGRVVVLVSTHTPKHLAAVLAGIGWQSRFPDAVCVACDTEDDRVEEIVREGVGRWRGGVPVVYTARGFMGTGRASQNRNNGLRALEEHCELRDEDAVVFLDGDIVLGPDALSVHARALADGAGMVYGGRANLSQGVTEGARWDTMPADPEGGRGWFERVWPVEEEEAIAKRARRYRRALSLRRAGLARVGAVKAHKPKVLSCHFACRVSVLRAVNGFDEAYEGWGWEDDDLGRRALLVQPARGLVEKLEAARAVHLWHPSRARDAMEATPNRARFEEGLRRQRREGVRSAWADAGWHSAREQGAVRTVVVCGAGSTTRDG